MKFVFALLIGGFPIEIEIQIIKLITYTHGIRSLTIPPIAYFINSLNGLSCGRGRGEPTDL